MPLNAMSGTLGGLSFQTAFSSTRSAAGRINFLLIDCRRASGASVRDPSNASKRPKSALERGRYREEE